MKQLWVKSKEYGLCHYKIIDKKVCLAEHGVYHITKWKSIKAVEEWAFKHKFKYWDKPLTEIEQLNNIQDNFKEEY